MDLNGVNKLIIPVFNSKRLDIDFYEIDLTGTGVKIVEIERYYDITGKYVDELVAYS
jgi:hypothetical protein